MRQQTRLLQHGTCGGFKIGERGDVSHLPQFISRMAITQFRFVAQREQRLLASRRAAGARDRHDFVDGKISTLPFARRMRKGAIVADIPAQLRQRNEDLTRIGNLRAVPFVAFFGRELHQIGERHPADERHDVGSREVVAPKRLMKRSIRHRLRSPCSAGWRRQITFSTEEARRLPLA